MVISVVPSKVTPLIVLAVCNFIASEAIPVRLAVIVPAEKFPLPSLKTILEAVLEEVAP